ncbi:hypothetical protein CYMTET_7238 [Cymbomonas tetramitiformis]|uniref:Uncharacterized protein n=1 Tax=Cymbomonas tetramitiformis TaxID=36881 RepID=A0AAE0LHN3_9CHLO|nr:hypothetical protein CYMTET_7238 [Cymbomonas tetramitiformis]
MTSFTGNKRPAADGEEQLTESQDVSKWQKTCDNASAGAAEGSAAAGAAAGGASASAPPTLFATTAAQQRQDVPRTIHITGAKGGRRGAGPGLCEMVLQPGQGLAELKKMIRQRFGKTPSERLGSLLLVNAEGQAGNAAKAADLVDGVKLRCTYTYAQGNIGNLTMMRGRGFGGGRFGGFGRMNMFDVFDLF